MAPRRCVRPWLDAADKPSRKRVEHDAATAAGAQVLVHGEPGIENEVECLRRDAHQIRFAFGSLTWQKPTRSRPGSPRVARGRCGAERQRPEALDPIIPVYERMQPRGQCG